MRKMIAALTVALSMTVAAPALADTPRRVSPGEYVKVDAGMTKARVHEIFDQGAVDRSERVAGEANEWMKRSYPAGCADCADATVYVTYWMRADGDWHVGRYDSGKVSKSWCDSGGCVHG